MNWIVHAASLTVLALSASLLSAPVACTPRALEHQGDAVKVDAEPATGTAADASPPEPSVHGAPAERLLRASRWKGGDGRERIGTRPDCEPDPVPCRLRRCQPVASLPPCSEEAGHAVAWSDARGRAEDHLGKVIRVSGSLETTGGSCTLMACLSRGQPTPDHRLDPPTTRARIRAGDSNICCNGCSAPIYVADDEEPLLLQGHACAGYDGLACCDLPADGRFVVAVGRLQRTPAGVDGVPTRYALETATLCQAGPDPAPAEPLAACRPLCGYALAASVGLPPGVSPAALDGAIATICRDDRCATADLRMVAADVGPLGWCLQWRPMIIGRDFGLRLADCEHGTWSLLLTYDAPRGVTLANGDRYVLDVRSKDGASVVHWDQVVSYGDGPPQASGEPCKEARIGNLDCKRPGPKDSVPFCF